MGEEELVNLRCIIPVFDFNYIGENKTSLDIWTDRGDFHKNLKEYIIDPQKRIVLRQFDYFSELNNVTYSCTTEPVN